MPLGSLTETFTAGAESVEESMMFFMWLAIVIYVLASSERAVRAFFLLIRTLQLIVHLPLMQIMMPANFITLINILVPVLGFDILESFLDWEEQTVVEFDDDN